MKRIVVGSLVLLALAVSAPQSEGPPRTASVAAAEGGADYFLCAAFQAIKVGGMVLGRPDAALLGAIGGGIACGFGW